MPNLDIDPESKRKPRRRSCPSNILPKWFTAIPHKRIAQFVFLFMVTYLVLVAYFTGTGTGVQDSPSSSLAAAETVPVPDIATPAAAADDQLSIVILTTENRPVSYTSLSLLNKHAYALRHNYDFLPLLAHHPGLPELKGQVWAKMLMLRDAFDRKDKYGLPKWDWVLWIDFDTLVTNISVSVEGVIAQELALAEREGRERDGVDMLVGRDCNPLNAGVFLMRNSEWSREFVTRVWERGMSGKEGEEGSEQDAMQRTLIDLGEIPGPYPRPGPKTPSPPTLDPRHVWMPDQHKLNAYPDEIGCVQDGSRQWRRGDWILHFPGAWAYLGKGVEDPYGVLMRKYEGRVVDR
ncbi:hypothetical protein YB2330_006594 [Saitoella coloradoensis]